MFNLSYRQRVFFTLLGLFGCLVTSQARTQTLGRNIPSSNQALNTSAQWGARSSGLPFQQFVNALPPSRIRTRLVEPQPRGQINSDSRRGQTLSVSDGTSRIVEQRPVLLNNSRGFTPFVSNSFPGFSFEDNGNTCGDTASGPYLALAVSQKYVVQLVNDCFSIYDKQGNLQPGYLKSLAVFFGVAVLGGNGQIFYDWVANRFVIGQLTSGNDGGVLYLAASASSDPTGAWHIYRLPVGGTGLFADYLQLGHNNRRDPFGET